MKKENKNNNKAAPAQARGPANTHPSQHSNHYLAMVKFFHQGCLDSVDARSERISNWFKTLALAPQMEELVRTTSERMKKAMEQDNVLVSSDLHFGHKNIIAYCNRPYREVSEMDKDLFEMFYGCFDSPQENILLVGDVAMGMVGTTRDELREFKKQSGKFMALVVGNHDVKNDACLYGQSVFDAILPFLFWDLQAQESEAEKTSDAKTSQAKPKDAKPKDSKTKEGKTLVMVTHYPLGISGQTLKNMGYAKLINIHGHTHNTIMTDTDCVKYVNVCWDVHKGWINPGVPEPTSI